MIKFENVTKTYGGDVAALKGISLHVKAGELITLIGPSGCGKTTTMRMINRLIEPTAGTIFIKNQDISKLDPIKLRRNTGYVIQEIGLFPHMTIEQNIALVPRLEKADPKKYAKRVDELLLLVGLDPETYKHRTPNELSGGQQQRIGVIRALAADPEIILMDEPFSALDPISRDQLQKEIVDLQDKIKKTIVFVTHDMDEAIKISDRIAIMRDGEIIQLDTPENILRHPKDDFVKDFIGSKRLQENNGNGIPTVQDMIRTEVVRVSPHSGLAEARYKMRQRKVDSLFVTDREETFQGLVTITELERNYSDESLKIVDIMRTEDLKILDMDDSIQIVAEIFGATVLNAIPVVSENKLVGIVTRSSMIRGLANWERGGDE